MVGDSEKGRLGPAASAAFYEWRVTCREELLHL